MDRLRVLILNAHHQPHRIAGWQEAICLWFSGKCDVLEHYEATVSSPSVTLQMPAVVRLRREVEMYKTGIKFSRYTVLLRDGFRCCYCGKRKASDELNYDHVVPRAMGGRTTWTNIATSCKRCNTRKGNRTPEQAGMPLLRKPYRPTTLPSQPLLVDVSRSPEQWRPYLIRQAETA